MIKDTDVYRIGRIGKPHGVKGELTFHFNDDVFDRTDAEYLFLEVEGILVPFFIEEYRFRESETALVKFCDIDTQEQARELTGCDVYFPRQLSDSTPETISWAEIAGFRLVDTHSGNAVGTIRHVDDSTLNILFETETSDGKTLLIPAHPELIEGVDAANKEIRINLPEGILNL